MCISQSTLDSIKTSQDDKVKINLTRLKDWIWQDYNYDIDYNLHIVKRLVQIDLKWMKRNQAQIKKKVNHLE